VKKSVVIAGAGHASGQVAASLRQGGFDGRIVVVGEEPFLPYQRPPLSKKYLAGELAAERLYVKPPSFYEEADVELELETKIEEIDRAAKCLRTNKGTPIDYDKLVLALGSRVRRLPVDGVNLERVHYLRTIANVDAIRADFDRGGRLVIIGAGYIGLEVAAVARQAGLDVTVVEMADRVMSRAVSAEVSDYYQIEHTNQGVKLRLSTSVAEIGGKKRVRHVTTEDGDEIPADLVIIGVGIHNGIVVDDHCLTNDPDIYAVGDCTLHPNDIYNRMLRLESVHNALEQAKTAAANICGEDTAYCDVPWFWSDQYDLKLQIAGLSEGYDDVVIRGNPAERSFSCLYLEQGRLIATDAINAPRDFVQSRQLIAARAEIDTARLADVEVALKDLSA
jgi:3-phenylpropionate/trans-cinnamate dioxygenase ferredoxin reductase subunit